MNTHIFNGREIKPDNRKNWGDLTPFDIISELSKSEKLKHSDVFNVKEPHKKYKIYSSGSVMYYVKPDSIVWGTGCIMEGGAKHKPKKVYSVRGPKTRETLINLNIECPEFYGDPALLFPMIYQPKVEKKHKWGLIPHYIEFDSPEGLNAIKHMESVGVKIIDVCAGKTSFIDEIMECDNILSSSLHGLIISDAYGVPNSRVKITDNVVGGNFKFDDYYMSVDRYMDSVVEIRDLGDVSDLNRLELNKEINFDGVKYIKNTAPWINNEFKIF